MAFVEDVSPFFADFGTPPTAGVPDRLDGAPVRGIFNGPYSAALGGIVTAEPTYTLPTVQASAVTTASLLVLSNGVTYRVRDIRPDGTDGTGVTELALERR